MMNWNENMSEAPRDGTVILLDVGMPWAVTGAWNPVAEEWVYASLQIGFFEGEYVDTYFENEHDKEAFAWASMPQLKKVDGWTLGAIARNELLSA